MDFIIKICNSLAQFIGSLSMKYSKQGKYLFNRAYDEFWSKVYKEMKHLSIEHLNDSQFIKICKIFYEISQ
jgi:hypothetical protein